MSKKKLSAKALAKFEAERDVWREVLNSVWEIKAGRGSGQRLKPSHTSFACDGSLSASASV